MSSPRPDSWSNVLTAAENADGTNGLAGTFVANGQSVCIDYNTLSWGYTNGAKSVKWDGDQVVSALADEQNRDRWIEALDQIKQLHQYSPQAADAGCTQQVNAIPNRISATSPYYGARPKIQSIERGRDFAGSVRAELFPSKEEKTVHGGAEGWVVFQDANTEVGRTFIEFMYQPQYFMQFLFLSPLHNVPPGNAGQSDQYQERLKDLSDAWSQQDIDKTFERAKYIQIPNTETEPANGVGRALVNNRVFATMRFNAVIRDNDPATVIDNTHQKANEMLSQAQQ